jgi:amino acid transporter
MALGTATTKETRRLALVGSGMAISIGNNAVLGSSFAHSTPLEVTLAVAIAGVLMLVIALCFVEMSAMFPGGVGLRAFTRAAFGEQWSTALTLLYILMAIGMGAFEAHLCYSVFRAWLPGAFASVLVTAILSLIVWINLLGFEAPEKLQTICTLAVVGMLWLLALPGLTHAPAPTPVLASARLGSGLLLAVPTALFLFVGVEWACYSATKRSTFAVELPRGVRWAIVIVASAYLPLSVAFPRVLDPRVIPTLELPHLALAPTGTAVWYLAIAISVLALTTTFNVGLGGTARMLYALAREGVLPKTLARLSAGALVPRRAVLLVAGVVLALVPWFELSTVVQSMPIVLAINLCVVYLLALCSWLKLKHTKQARPSLRSSMPVWPVVAAMAVLAIVLCDALASHLSSGVALVMLGELVLIGSVTALRPVPEALVEQ